MHLTLAGGTDAAGMELFDPAALGDDFDSQMKGDPADLMEQLAREGRLYWINTHADGGFSLGV
jgi:hypothetical protein